MTISIEQAQLKLAELIEKSSQGEEVVITRNEQVVAQIIPRQGKRHRREPGFAKDVIRIISDDDEHLKDFAPYMDTEAHHDDQH